MTAKYRAAERRRRRAEEAAKISRADLEALELMRALRPHAYHGDLGDSPRHQAHRALLAAIDEMAGVITGDREYFFAKPHSLAQGPKGSASAMTAARGLPPLGHLTRGVLERRGFIALGLLIGMGVAIR